jgi:hypothetical protein
VGEVHLVAQAIFLLDPAEEGGELPPLALDLRRPAEPDPAQHQQRGGRAGRHHGGHGQPGEMTDREGRRWQQEGRDGRDQQGGQTEPAEDPDQEGALGHGDQDLDRPGLKRGNERRDGEEAEQESHPGRSAFG